MPICYEKDTWKVIILKIWWLLMSYYIENDFSLENLSDQAQKSKWETGKGGW